MESSFDPAGEGIRVVDVQILEFPLATLRDYLIRRFTDQRNFFNITRFCAEPWPSPFQQLGQGWTSALRLRARICRG